MIKAGNTVRLKLHWTAKYSGTEVKFPEGQLGTVTYVDDGGVGVNFPVLNDDGVTAYVREDALERVFSDGETVGAIKMAIGTEVDEAYTDQLEMAIDHHLEEAEHFESALDLILDQARTEQDAWSVLRAVIVDARNGDLPELDQV